MSTYEANRYAFPASSITSGSINGNRLAATALNASNLSSGFIPPARVGTLAVNQHVDLSNLNASNLTSGTVPDARVSASSVTAHVSAVTQQTGSWSPSLNVVRITISTFWARYYRVGNHCTVIALMRATARTTRDTNETDENRISGLPFTSANTGNYAGFGTMSGGTGHRVWVKSNVSYLNIANNGKGDPRELEDQAPYYRGTKLKRQTLWDHLYSSTGGEGHFYFECTYQV